MKRNSTIIKALRVERAYWMSQARMERRWMLASIANARKINKTIARLQKEIDNGLAR